MNTEQFGCLKSRFSIDCKASGNPAPNINITGPDGKPRPKDGFVLSEFGIYRCEASSPLGNDSLNITISQMKGTCHMQSFVSIYKALNIYLIFSYKYYSSDFCTLVLVSQRNYRLVFLSWQQVSLKTSQVYL